MGVGANSIGFKGRLSADEKCESLHKEKKMKEKTYISASGLSKAWLKINIDDRVK